jgi:hypothetical protein
MPSLRVEFNTHAAILPAVQYRGGCYMPPTPLLQTMSVFISHATSFADRMIEPFSETLNSAQGRSSTRKGLGSALGGI